MHIILSERLEARGVVHDVEGLLPNHLDVLGHTCRRTSLVGTHGSFPIGLISNWAQL